MVEHPELLTRPQAAKLLSLSEATLRRWYARNIGPRVVKLGSARSCRVRYPLQDLRLFAADPISYAANARPEHLGHFEPPSRGNPRRVKGAT